MKTKQKKKSGHVVRVSDEALTFVDSVEGESVREKLENLIEETRHLRKETRAKKFYALPSDLCDSVEEARGLAVVRAVKQKKKPEEPVVVRAAV